MAKISQATPYKVKKSILGEALTGVAQTLPSFLQQQKQAETAEKNYALGERELVLREQTAKNQQAINESIQKLAEILGKGWQSAIQQPGGMG